VGSEGGTEAGAIRRRAPLVSPAAVRRWAEAVGIEVGDGPIDRTIIELYVDRARDDEDGAERRSAACPRCGRPGIVDHIDVVEALQSRRCGPCGVRWTSRG
jgi:hypothetical protein